MTPAGRRARVRGAARAARRWGAGTGPHRPAASGMIENFILIGISIAGVGVLAAWYVGFGGSGGDGSVWTNAHCTLYVDGHLGVNDVGDKHYVEVTVRNTGSIDIDGFVARVGDTNVFDHPHAILPGETGGESRVIDEAPSSGRGGGGWFAEAVATYADGSTTICDRVWSPVGGG